MFRQKWFISLLCILGFAIPSYAIDGVEEDVADVVSVTRADALNCAALQKF